LDTLQLYELFKAHPDISTDTRLIKEDSIFFALKGERFNGNHFTAEALNKRAAYSIIDEEEFLSGDQTILVPDVLKALQDLASVHRAYLDIPVIGITGSNGKTTTRSLIEVILSSEKNVLATAGNFNNHIGVPLTILKCSDKHEIAVIEMGANHIGEIRDLCAIARPDHGIITNVGNAHLEGFGSLENVFKAKSELFDHLRTNNGLVFLNVDHPYLQDMAEGLKVRSYGSKSGAEIKGTLEEAFPFLKISIEEPAMELQTNLHGSYNFENVLSAVCVGLHFNIYPEKIVDAIESYVPSNNRSQVIEKDSNTYVLDAYNANPASMELTIDHFAKYPAKNKVVIIGDMLELGTFTAREHQKVVNQLQKHDFQQVVLVGTEFEKTNAPAPFMKFADVEEVNNWMIKNPISNSHILVKGSRLLELERVVENSSTG